MKFQGPILLLGAALAAAPLVLRGADAPKPLAHRMASVVPANTSASFLFRPLGARDAAGPLAVQWRSSEPMTPASTQKLLTAWALLSLNGPSHTLPTAVYQRRDGDQSDLIVVSSGTPDLFAERMWLMGQTIAQSGVSDVRNVILDGRVFEPANAGPDWPDGQRTSWYIPTLSPFLYNAGLTTVEVHPGTTGRAPLAVLVPATSWVKLDNRATGKPGATTLNASLRATHDGETIVLTGNLPPGSSGWDQTFSVQNPEAYFGDALKRALGQAGVRVTGVVQSGQLPDDAAFLCFHEGRTLREMVTDMLKVSSNAFAESLLRTLSCRWPDQPGSTAASCTTLSAMLKGAGLPMDGVRIVDGSGLSRSDRVTTDLLVSVLERVHGDPSFGPEFVAALPIAGADGTLRRRFSKLPDGVVIRAKTGQLRDVHSLAGYLFVPGQEPVAFAVVLNGPGSDPGLIDRIVRTYVSEWSGEGAPGRKAAAPP